MPKKNIAANSQRKENESVAMKRNRVKLTDDERRKFDDIGLDEINQLTDMPSLQKLMQYMEYVPDS